MYCLNKGPPLSAVDIHALMNVKQKYGLKKRDYLKKRIKKL